MPGPLARLPGLLAAGALACAAVPVGAAPTTPDAMAAAASTLANRIRAATYADGAIPSLADPADARMYNIAFDRDGIRAVPLDLPTFVKLCGPIVDATQALIAWGNKVPAGSDGEESGRRLLRIQDELVMASVAADLCGKRSLRAAVPLVEGLAPAERTAERRAGLRQMQEGGPQVLLGLLYMNTDTGLTKANHEALIAGALEDADAVASAITPDGRAAFRAQALSVAATADPAMRARIERLAHLFERTDCGVLCSFSLEP